MPEVGALVLATIGGVVLIAKIIARRNKRPPKLKPTGKMNGNKAMYECIHDHVR